MILPRKIRQFSPIWMSCLALAALLSGCSSEDTSPDGAGPDGAGGAGGAGGSARGSSSPGAGPGGATTSGSAGSTMATGSASSGTGGEAPTGACPPNATFCSGFEEVGIPVGATYHPSYEAAQWANAMTIGGGVVHAGAQALEVKPAGGGYSWRMLGVPTPGPTFWARLYVRSDVDLGQAEHNAFFQAMTGDGEPNTGDNIEVAEQFQQVVLNLHDDVALSIGGTISGGGAHLAKDTWHCMEAYFDGPQGNVQIYADGTKIIDKTAWRTLMFRTFSFGFLSFHGPARTMWYDDVAVAPDRIGCAP